MPEVHSKKFLGIQVSTTSSRINQPTVSVVLKLRNVPCFFVLFFCLLMRTKQPLGLFFPMVGELMDYIGMSIHMDLSPRNL